MSLHSPATILLAAVFALALWKALRWMQRHWEMMRATAPKPAPRAAREAAITAQPTAPSPVTTPLRSPPAPVYPQTTALQPISPPASTSPLVAAIAVAEPRQLAPPTAAPQLLLWEEEAESQDELPPHPVNDVPVAARFKMDDENNADPIDGMLLLPGEPTVRCSCGLLYRAESFVWLQQHLGGSCVQCNQQIVPRRSGRDNSDHH